MHLSQLNAVVFVTGMLSACAVADPPALPVEAGMGPNPQLPQPQNNLIPTVNIAPAKGWPPEAKPIAPQGFTVSAYASGLDHPRWLYVLPNGDVLVGESDAPAKPDDKKGVKGFVMKEVMKKAGSGVRPSANRITLLRGLNADGSAAMKSVFLSNLHSPFGMALVGNNLYVANTDAIRRFSYKEGQTEIKEAGVKLADLPAGSINHHWTKNILASPDLTGFLSDDGDAYGRPVGVAVDKTGALLVADVVGNVIWRVAPLVASQPK